jgi:hypothetical protein
MFGNPAQTKLIIDGTVAGSAISIPIWLTQANAWLAFVLGGLAIILMLFRIGIARKELLGPKEGRRKEDK